MIQLKRYENNPVIGPNPNNEWEKGAVFNCGATIFNNEVMLLYRAIGNYDTYVSTLSLAKSKDGYNFDTYAEPAMKPEVEYERFGVEDP